jgi:hypothetical protein
MGLDVTDEQAKRLELILKKREVLKQGATKGATNVVTPFFGWTSSLWGYSVSL